MALFDFLKSQKEKVVALQQQIKSLKEEVSSQEKKKEELQLQVLELENQIFVQKNELHDLQENKEKTKKQTRGRHSCNGC